MPYTLRAVGFRSLLERRLGPLEPFLGPRPGPRRPELETLWIRRAAGLEVHVAPSRTQADVLAMKRRSTAGRDELEALIALTEWTDGARWASRTASRWLDQGLAVWARFDPGIPLPAAALPSGWTGPVARRPHVWPTPAIETDGGIGPIPFMPRGRELDGAAMVGLRFSTLERGHEILGVTVAEDATTGADLGALLPALDGRRSAAEILAAADRSDRQRLARLLDWLGAAGVLGPVPEPLESLHRPGPTATWLGHASVLLGHDRRGVLVDPCFYPPSAPPASPLPPDPRTLPPLELVLITHGDNDHLNPNALAQLDRRTPVVIPAVKEPRPAHQVDMEGLLRVLGFRTIRSMRPFERIESGAFTVVALPFDGEDWGLEQAQLSYLVEMPGFSVFLSADSLGPEATYRWLAERPSPVDLAFMGVSGVVEPMVAPPGLGYGNFYARWIPPALHGEVIRHTAGPQDSARFCAMFRPSFAFGYAAGGAPFIATEYPDRGDHDSFAAALRGGPTTPVRLPLGAPVGPAELGALPP